jgi:hypothetical protein
MATYIHHSQTLAPSVWPLSCHCRLRSHLPRNSCALAEMPLWHCPHRSCNSHSLNQSINQRNGCTAQATEARLKVQTHIHTNVEAVETIIERVAKAHQLHIDGVDKLLGALSADASSTTTRNPPPPPPPPPPHVDVSAGSASTPPLLTPQPDPPFHGTGLLWVPTSELIPAVFDNDHTYRTPLELLQTEENRWRDVLLRHTGRRPKV